MFQTIFTVLFPLIGLITLGYVLKQRKWLEDSFWRGQKNSIILSCFQSCCFKFGRSQD